MGDDNDNPVLNSRLEVNKEVWDLSSGKGDEGQYIFEYGEGIDIITGDGRIDTKWYEPKVSSNSERHLLEADRFSKIEKFKGLYKYNDYNEGNSDARITFWRELSKTVNRKNNEILYARAYVEPIHE